MNNDVYEIISNMTIGELINNLKNRENYSKNNSTQSINNSIIQSIDKEATILLDTNELIEQYPFFTRYNLKKAIEEDNLKFICIGNKRFFEKKDIEKWIDYKYKKKNKEEYDF